MVPPDDVFAIPPIQLQDLPERTKDYVLARCGQGENLREVLREILNDAAREAGFDPAKERGAA